MATAKRKFRVLVAGSGDKIYDYIVQTLPRSSYDPILKAEDAGETRRLLLQSGAAAARMTGSGSAVFGLYRTGEQAQAAARSLSRQRWAVFCHSTEGEEAAW